tara:strand:- start:44 stop:352 length:309 start_codon:yes stop_codon:yes gene_type:complete
MKFFKRKQTHALSLQDCVDGINMCRARVAVLEKKQKQAECSHPVDKLKVEHCAGYREVALTCTLCGYVVEEEAGVVPRRSLVKNHNKALAEHYANIVKGYEK